MVPSVSPAHAPKLFSLQLRNKFRGSRLLSVRFSAGSEFYCFRRGNRVSTTTSVGHVPCGNTICSQRASVGERAKLAIITRRSDEEVSRLCLGAEDGMLCRIEFSRRLPSECPYSNITGVGA